MTPLGPGGSPAGALGRAGPLPRPLVVLGVVLFCAGCWTGCYFAGSRAISATHAELKALERVNQQLNWSIHFKPAKDFHPNEHEGDCKTAAATKRQALIAQGWARDRLKVWLVKDETRHDHAVLVVDGEIVLDNRFAWTERMGDLKTYGYRFLNEVYWIDTPPAPPPAPMTMASEAK